MNKVDAHRPERGHRPERRRRSRLGATAVGLVAVLITLGFTAPSSAEPAVPAAPTISVTPATNLVQGDDVTITGSGFPGDTLLAFVQCIPGGSQDFCNLSNIAYVTSSPSGNISTVFTPRRVLRIAGVDHDCAVESCVIGGGTVPDGSGGTATAAIAFDPSVPPPPPPVVTVTPSTNLLEGETVTVTGANFEANAGMGVVQCATPPSSSGSNCNVSGVKFITVGSDGAFSTTFVVHRMLYNGGTTDCAVAGACVIGVGSGDPSAGDTADITFDASVPPPPPPTLTATPSTGLANGQTVTVHGAGYPASTSLGMAQCVTGDESSERCDLSNVRFVTTDAEGAFTTTFIVHTSYQSPTGPIDCKVDGFCRIGAGVSEGGLGASALLSFAATTPTTTKGGTTVAGAVTVAPSFTG